MINLKALISCLILFHSGILLAQQSGSEHEEATIFKFSYELSVLYDDNIRRAKYDEDIREDSILGATLGLTTITHLTDHTLLILGAKADLEKYSEFEELDNVIFTGSAKYRFSFGSKFSSPTYSLNLSLGGIDSESEMRSGDIATLSMDMNKWLTTTINMTLRLSSKKIESQSKVFDTTENQFMLNFDVDLSPRQLVYVTYHFIDGDIVSSATPKLATINVAQAIEPDDAFGGLVTNQFAYRIDAQSNVFTLGYNAALGKSLSFDFSYRFIDSESTIDPSNVYYERTMVRASILGRF